MPSIESFNVDFNPNRMSLIDFALSRSLDQHQGKPIYTAFLTAFLKEVNELYAAIIDLQEQRSLYHATDSNLEALGRIVGTNRNVVDLDESIYVHFDETDQSCDSSCVEYVPGAELNNTTYEDDLAFRNTIINQINRNNMLYASYPEVQLAIRVFISKLVKFQRTGPMRVQITAPDSMGLTAIDLLVRHGNQIQGDDLFFFPYPATLDIDDDVVYYPDGADEGPFMWDSDTNCFDVAPWAVFAHIDFN
jgi:hypothetical protein